MHPKLRVMFAIIAGHRFLLGGAARYGWHLRGTLQVKAICNIKLPRRFGSHRQFGKSGWQLQSTLTKGTSIGPTGIQKSVAVQVPVYLAPASAQYE
jgi:hypothetical protein